MTEHWMPGSQNNDLPFEFQQKQVPAQQQNDNWKQIEQVIAGETPVKTIAWKRYITAAAAALLLVLSTIWYFRAGEQDIHFYQTTFSQVKHIRLPDGSKVTLNANSQLRLSADWSDKGDRQVWLDGEAYFEVEKKPATHQKFVVHAKDINVEVLGTKFNVNTRHEKAVVALEEGSIKLSLQGETKTVLRNKVSKEVFEMKPGEVLKLDTATGIALAEEPNINFHSGWVRNEFHFNNTSLREIATMVKDIYGYTMEVSDEALLKRSISGDLRAASLHELVEVLQLAFRLKMTIDNKTIKITQP